MNKPLIYCQYVDDTFIVFILVLRNTQCTCTCQGREMFRRGSKLRSRQPLNPVSLPSNFASSTRPDNSCLQPIRIYYLLPIIATLSSNFCAAVTVGRGSYLPEIETKNETACSQIFLVRTYSARLQISFSLQPIQ